MEPRIFKIDKILFKEIDFEEHSDICVKYRADSFKVSFGNEDGFWEEDGRGDERYLAWLKNKDPKVFGSFHIWTNNQIIGQMELGLFHGDSSYGYIPLLERNSNSTPNGA